jgi:hypothetical protein
MSVRASQLSHQVMQTEAVSSATVTRRALEPAGRAFAAPYAAALASIGRLRDRDAKHGARFAMENLAALQPAVDGLAAAAPDLAVQARDRRFPSASQLRRSQNLHAVDGDLRHACCNAMRQC